MPAPVLFCLTILLAVVDWIGTERGWKKIRFVTKPGTLAALIAWFSLAVGWSGSYFWFGLGLLFSLLGDVNLLFPSRFFLPGLVSFLLAHVFYILGFLQAGLPSNPLSLVVVLGVAGLGSRIFSLLYSGLLKTDEGRKLRLPVSVYSLTISLMLASAWMRLFLPDLALGGVLCSAVGAALFFLSDSVLAYNRFVRQTPHHDLLVMSTYHLAQIAIIAGLIL